MIRTPLALGSVQREARARGADVWTYRYRDGKRHRSVLLGRTNEMTEQAAHKKAHRLRSQIFENRNRVTVGSIVDRYLAEDMPTRQSTASSYRSMLTRIRGEWGSLMFDDFIIDVSGVERWLRDLKTLPRMKKDGRVTKVPEPVSRKTKDHYKAVLHRLVECAMRWGLVDIQRNPVGLVEVRTGARRKRVPTIITFEQYRQLLEREELGGHVRVMVQLAMCLGLRASEILGLRWEDVDLLGGTIRIQRSVVGKYQDETKTESSAETLPLHESLVKVLMEWRMAAPIIEGWLFGSPITERPYHRDSLHKDYLTPAALKIGLPRLGWHDFRHTYRAMLRDLRLPLEVQQKLMRHASITMTVHYGNSGMDEDKREANRQVVEYVTQTQNGSTRKN
jgi:integrase